MRHLLSALLLALPLAAWAQITPLTEADAVRGFMYLVRHREAKTTLMETPPSLPDDLVVDTATARDTVARALADGRAWLDPGEVAHVLTAYGIPITPVVTARDADEAARMAEPMLADGGTLAVKILSPDITHKSDVGGVRLGLATREAVEECARSLDAMYEKVLELFGIPDQVLSPLCSLDAMSSGSRNLLNWLTITLPRCCSRSSISWRTSCVNRKRCTPTRPRCRISIPK